jgi:hypothetical protein
MAQANTPAKHLILLAVAASLLFATRGIAELPPGLHTPTVSFYQGELYISGNRWLPVDPTEKSIDGAISIRCKRKPSVCALARSGAFLNVEFLTVVSWTSKRVTLRGETLHPSCSNSDYVVDVARRSVSLISIPGSLAERVECRVAPYEKPKRTVYELAYEGARR